MKKCTKCLIEKPLSNFWYDKRYKTPRSWCKECQTEVNKKWRDKNKSRNNELNKQHQLNYKLKHIYNLSLEEYQKLVLDNDGVCQICRKKKKLYIDHNHSTNRFRGLLCSTCNSGLGMFGHDEQIIFNAIKYLKPSGPNGLTEEIL